MRLWGCILAVGLGWADPGPVPTPAELAKAQALVEEVYGKQLRAAKTPIQKTALAWEILQAAREETADTTTKYAALQQAKKLALDARDGKLGLQIVQELASGFQPQEQMSPEQILQEADRLWHDAEHTQGRQKLAKQLQVAELYLRLPPLKGLDRLRLEKRLEAVGEENPSAKPLPLVRLINHQSGLALGIRASQMHPGADAIQWDTPPHVKDSQWQIEGTGSQVRFRNHNSGLYLGVREASKNPGSQLCQLPPNDPSTLWILEAQDGFYKIKNVHSGLYLAIFGGGRNRGYHAIQEKFINHPSQHWRLVPLK